MLAAKWKVSAEEAKGFNEFYLKKKGKMVKRRVK